MLFGPHPLRVASLVARRRDSSTRFLHQHAGSLGMRRKAEHLSEAKGLKLFGKHPVREGIIFGICYFRWDAVLLCLKGTCMWTSTKK